MAICWIIMNSSDQRTIDGYDSCLTFHLIQKIQVAITVIAHYSSLTLTITKSRQQPLSKKELRYPIGIVHRTGEDYGTSHH